MCHTGTRRPVCEGISDLFPISLRPIVEDGRIMGYEERVVDSRERLVDIGEFDIGFDLDSLIVHFWWHEVPAIHVC